LFYLVDFQLAIVIEGFLSGWIHLQNGFQFLDFSERCMLSNNLQTGIGIHSQNVCIPVLGVLKKMACNHDLEQVLKFQVHPTKWQEL